jgi:flagellar basal-body rod modification protein FlgD
MTTSTATTGVAGATSAAATNQSSRALPVGPGGAMGKDEFLKLLVAQLKNQDPENTMDGQQLAAQLAQFSQLEQLVNISESLQTQQASQASLLQALNGGVALNALGKNVIAIGNDVVIPGDFKVEVAVGAGGGSATLHLYDSSGREVGSRALGEIGGGRQMIELGSAAAGLPSDHYTYSVDVKDSTGKEVSTQTFVTGRVDGVAYGQDGPVVTIGPISLPIGSIVEIKN